MKGHMEKDGFHPHTQNKGVRKSRDQKSKTDGVKIERKAREKKFKPVLDEDGDIDTHDQTNQMKLEELVEEETARREEKLIEDEDAYEELLNSGTDDVTSMGVTVGAGTFLRQHDHIAFRTSLLDYADGTRQEIKDELEEEIDEEESLEEGKYVGF
jgi:hypothetical protein